MCPDCGKPHASPDCAVTAPSADPAYERRWELSILIGPCDFDAAEEFLVALTDKFGDHLGAAYSMAPWDEEADAARGAVS